MGTFNETVRDMVNTLKPKKDYQCYRPKRVYDGEIQLGDLVEIVVNDTDRHDETRMLIVVDEIAQTDKGYRILGLQYSDSTYKNGVTMRSNTATYTKRVMCHRDTLFARVCRISFDGLKRIQKEYDSLVVEKKRQKEQQELEWRMKQEEEERKRLEREQERVRAREAEELRRSQPMTITVGMWEDMITFAPSS